MACAVRVAVNDRSRFDHVPMKESPRLQSDSALWIGQRKASRKNSARGLSCGHVQRVARVQPFGIKCVAVSSGAPIEKAKPTDTARIPSTSIASQHAGSSSPTARGFLYSTKREETVRRREIPTRSTRPTTTPLRGPRCTASPTLRRTLHVRCPRVLVPSTA